LTCSALVAQAGVPAAEEDGATTAGVLLLLVVGALGLAAGVEPDAAGWLLPDDAHPATAVVQTSAAAVRASRPALSTTARVSSELTKRASQCLPSKNKRFKA
jgi:hypothetical protein